jgi:hypothetical protein
MSNDTKIRWGWLKFMYIYTIVGAGGFGLAIIVVPDFIRSLFSMPGGDPITFGISGSFYLAAALVSILGLRDPLKFVPILVIELCYKLIWFIGVVFPFLITGRFPSYAIPIAIIFATYIIGNLIAIPFSYVFTKQPHHEP